MRRWIYGGIGFALGLAAVFLLEPRPVGRADRSLQEQLAEERARTRELEAELEGLRAAAPLPATEAPPGPTEARPAAEPAGAPVEIPAAVRQAGAALGVPDDALRAAIEAHGKPSPENLERLSRHGAAGFRALVAMLRGGLSGTKFDALFTRCWTPAAAGQERALIELADTETLHEWSRWTALRALGSTDTPAAREYLVARLQSETDAGLFMCAATAAGQLRESRALPDLLRGMRNRDWGEPVRRDIILAAVEVAGDRARDVLIDYVREPNADLLGNALFQLERIDADAARREAAALLAGPRADSLTAEQLADLRRYAGGK
jgi:hypothetical protein